MRNRRLLAVAFVLPAIGLMAFDWPEIDLQKGLDWFKPRKAEPSEAVRQRRADKVRQVSYELDGWRMTIQTDGFTGRVRCHLFSPKTLTQGRITYAQGTLGFQLEESETAIGAWYRIDKGQTHAAEDLYPQLVANRVRTGGGPLENPTAGVVMIPRTELMGATVVTIRQAEGDTPRRFKLRGFEKALAAAEYNGCVGQDVFERYSW